VKLDHHTSELVDQAALTDSSPPPSGADRLRSPPNQYVRSLPFAILKADLPLVLPSCISSTSMSVPLDFLLPTRLARSDDQGGWCGSRVPSPSPCWNPDNREVGCSVPPEPRPLCSAGPFHQYNSERHFLPVSLFPCSSLFNLESFKPYFSTVLARASTPGNVLRKRAESFCGGIFVNRLATTRLFSLPVSNRLSLCPPVWRNRW